MRRNRNNDEHIAWEWHVPCDIVAEKFSDQVAQGEGYLMRHGRSNSDGIASELHVPCDTVAEKFGEQVALGWVPQATPSQQRQAI
jgi:hypothetical protein